MKVTKYKRNIIYKTFFGLLICLFFISKIGNASTLKTDQDIVTIDLESVTLEKALATIEGITEYKFFYRNEDINLAQKVTVKATNKSLNYVLLKLFKKDDINFKIINHQIILKKNTSKVLLQKNHKVKGKVIDISTGKPIYNCNIKLANTYTGTATNELGEFVIQITSFPVQLVFSHLNYESQVITLSDIKTAQVQLIPRINTLNEVIISGTDNYAIDLAKKAFKKTIKSSTTNKFGTAFYRQTIKNDEDYSEFSEIIYDAQYSTAGIEKWDIIEGRYAIKEEKINNKNYTLLSKLLKSLQPNTEEILFPLNKHLDKLYNIKTLQKIKSKDNTVAVLWFEPKEKNASIPSFEGEVYIDTKTHDVLKVTGEISRDDLELIRLTKKNTTKRDYILSYEMTFKVDSILGLVIDYIDVKQEFDYYQDNIFQTHISSKSSLNFFEYYIPTNKKKLGRQFKKNISDWQRLDEIGYNKKFWEDNPIIKRTPVEEEVITSFEKNNAFESIFLNSRNQIAIEQSDISNYTFIEKLNKQFQIHNDHTKIEKVYLHTNKDICISGENLWYSAYVTLGSYHNYSLASNVLHIDLIDPNGEIISTQKQELIEGRGYGTISIPKNLEVGIYQLRSYTNWMRNENSAFFFTKTIKIVDNKNVESHLVSKKKSFDLQFFPEGGNAIAGINNTIAFKAIGSDGLGVNIKGRIVNSNGTTIAHINSLHKGAGIFNLNPQKGEKYKAILEDNSEVSLPKIQDQGYAISIDNKNKRNIRVKVQATEALRSNVFYIIGHVRNQKYYQAQLAFGDTDIVDFEIPKKRIPSGVMTLTLLDHDMKPWCERAIFINNQEELVITTQVDEENLKPRSKLTVDIKVTDSYGNPISTDLSISVTDADKINKNIYSSNILTQLLLESDIKGHIENPAFYFQDTHKNTRAKLDLLMLTNGWRRFNWESMQNEKKKFSFTKGLHISGIIKDRKNKTLNNTKLDMVAKSNNSFRLYSSKTDYKGRFDILNFNNIDSTKLMFNVYNEKGTIVNANIYLDKNEIKPPVSNFRSNILETFIDNEQNSKYIKTIKYRKREDSLLDLSKTIALNEVFLKGKKKVKKLKETPNFYGVEPDATLFITEKNNIGSLILQIAKLPGVSVLGSGIDAKVSINRSQAPLWVLDGVPIFNKNVVSSEGPSRKFLPYPQGVIKIPSIISQLSLLDIYRIDVLKPAKAAVYGSRGSEGVISIETRRGKNILSNSTSEENKPLWTHSVMGYNVSKEFYNPKYDVKNSEQNNTDYRTTLLWNPNITTNNEGEASISFFNSDITNQIQIVIEGLSTNGIPGVHIKKIGKEKQND